MNSDTFTVRCGDCGRAVTIRSVSEFHCAGQHDGYSYIYACECGTRVAVDGCDGDDIPDSMKIAAAARRSAHQVLHIINLQRRQLPPTDAKVQLRNARLDLPESIGNDEWLVYRSDDGWSVTFRRESEEYFLHDADSVRAFPDIDAISANLRGG